MSAIKNTPVKKVPTVPKTSAAEPDASADAAKAAIADIMAHATIAAEDREAASRLNIPVISMQDRDLTGKSALGERTAENQGQADFIPGTKNIDLPYIPDIVEDEQTGIARRLLSHQDYHYIWVSHDLLTRFRANQYKFIQYDGGPRSGLLGDGFKHTGLFERTIEGRVMLGDTYLMYIPKRQYEAIVEEEQKRLHELNAPGGEMFNEGYRMGVRTFIEDAEGKPVYN